MKKMEIVTLSEDLKNTSKIVLGSEKNFYFGLENSSSQEFQLENNNGTSNSNNSLSGTIGSNLVGVITTSIILGIMTLVTIIGKTAQDIFI